MSATGPGPRRGEKLLMEGPNGAVYVRTMRGGKVRLRAYRNDGDTIREAELAIAALKLFDTVYRDITGTGVKLTRVLVHEDHA